KLSASLGRTMERVKLVCRILRNTAIIKVYSTYTKIFAPNRYNRFRRQIQRIDRLLFWATDTGSQVWER
ncbi:PIPO, partial [Narcissus yellow stripe virus]|uniref:PIPO n=1 Tax=Narcissus yellow stripe virus TaxID=160843 RepID=UPI00026515E4